MCYTADKKIQTNVHIFCQSHLDFAKSGEIIKLRAKQKQRKKNQRRNLCGKRRERREGLSEGDLADVAETGKADQGDRAMRGSKGAFVLQRAGECGGLRGGHFAPFIRKGRLSRAAGKGGKYLRAADAGGEIFSRIQVFPKKKSFGKGVCGFQL